MASRPPARFTPPVGRRSRFLTWSGTRGRAPVLEAIVTRHPPPDEAAETTAEPRHELQTLHALDAAPLIARSPDGQPHTSAETAPGRERHSAPTLFNEPCRQLLPLVVDQLSSAWRLPPGCPSTWPTRADQCGKRTRYPSSRRSSGRSFAESAPGTAFGESFPTGSANPRATRKLLQAFSTRPPSTAREALCLSWKEMYHTFPTSACFPRLDFKTVPRFQFHALPTR